MDLLQVALVFLILLLAVFLSVLGIQVFFILKDLRRSLDKLDDALSDVQINDSVTNKQSDEIQATVQNVVNGAKNIISKTSKPVTKSLSSKRLMFKRRR